MNKFYFFLFIVLFTLLYCALHYFVYIRIVNSLKLNSVSCALLRAFFLCAALSFFVDKLLHNRLFIKSLAYFGAIWLGIISIAFSLFVLQYCVELALSYKSMWFTVFTLILILSLSLFSIKRASHTRVKEIAIPIENLPPQLNGFTIVQLSDLHLDRLKSLEWLQSIIDTTNKLKPDSIVITGDLLDSECNDTIDRFSPLFRKLSSPHGIIAITGNHEYYAGIDKFLEFAEKSNITVLQNASLTIKNTIQIIGINDDTGKRFSESGKDLTFALRECDLLKPLILLSHKPEGFSKAAAIGVDLQLSGHTHAGQIPPFDFLVHLLYKYAYGLHTEESSFIYTTSGTGTWGPPMRLFSHSEIVKILLTQ
ncbi:MAG: metallophosphoesterase [bacterium]